MMLKIRTQGTQYAETVESEIDTFIMQNTDVSLLFYKLSERHFPVWMPPSVTTSVIVADSGGELRGKLKRIVDLDKFIRKNL